jgi:DNA modification methylase
MIEFGDCREIMTGWAELGMEKAQTCVTSPPYFGLRDYGHEGQIGLEETPDQYQVAVQNGRRYLGCELNTDYKQLQDERINAL